MSDHCTPQSMPRTVTIGTAQYCVRVQGYNFLAQPPHSNFVLKTFIEVVSSGNHPQLLGSLASLSDPIHPNPDLRKIPVFSRIDAQMYHSKRAVYIGADGFQQATNDLAAISDYALAQSINYYIIQHFESTILLLLRMYDSLNKKWYTVKQIDAKREDFKDGKPPLTYRWDNILFDQSSVINDSGISHIIYVPSEIKLRQNNAN